MFDNIKIKDENIKVANATLRKTRKFYEVIIIWDGKKFSFEVEEYISPRQDPEYIVRDLFQSVVVGELRYYLIAAMKIFGAHNA